MHTPDKAEYSGIAQMSDNIRDKPIPLPFYEHNFIDRRPQSGYREMKAETDIYDLVIRKRLEILSLAQRRGARNVRIFGSVARKDARPDSDIDLLVDLDPDRSLLDIGGLAMDLTRLLDHPVDIVSEAGLRERIRARVLSEARAL